MNKTGQTRKLLILVLFLLLAAPWQLAAEQKVKRSRLDPVWSLFLRAWTWVAPSESTTEPKGSSEGPRRDGTPTRDSSEGGHNIDPWG